MPGATIRTIPVDFGRLPVPVSPAAPSAGPAAIAGELVGRARASPPPVGGLGEREQVLVSAWLTGLRSARTADLPVAFAVRGGGHADDRVGQGCALHRAEEPGVAEVIYGPVGCHQP